MGGTTGISCDQNIRNHLFIVNFRRRICHLRDAARRGWRIGP
jgi:hypothetical protein